MASLGGAFPAVWSGSCQSSLRLDRQTRQRNEDTERMTKAAVMGLAGSGHPGVDASSRGGSDPVAGSESRLSGMCFNFIWILAAVIENTSGRITSSYMSVDLLSMYRSFRIGASCMASFSVPVRNQQQTRCACPSECSFGCCIGSIVCASHVIVK